MTNSFQELHALLALRTFYGVFMSVAECGIRAFQWNMEAAVPRILIAVDTSSHCEAVQKIALEVFEKHIQKTPICITHLNYSTDWIQIETRAQLEQLFDQDFIGAFKNKWSPLFSKITEVYGTYNQKAKVIIISDMQHTKTGFLSQVQRLVECPPNQPLKLHFCQIGQSQTALQPSDMPRMRKTTITHEAII